MEIVRKTICRIVFSRVFRNRKRSVKSSVVSGKAERSVCVAVVFVVFVVFGAGAGVGCVGEGNDIDDSGVDGILVMERIRK